MLPLTPDQPQPPHHLHGFTPSLAQSSLRYISALRDGAFLVIVAMTINFFATVGMLGAQLLLPPIPESGAVAASEPLAIVSMVYLIAMLVSITAGVMGWWWLTTRDPQEEELAEPSHSRPVVRSIVLAQSLLMLAIMAGPFLLVAFAGNTSPDQAVGGSLVILVAVSLCAFAAVVVKFFATMSYLRWIAHRMPDETLDSSAARFMWLGPVLVTLGSLIIVGPLIAVIMYFGLIFKTWASLCEIAKSRREQLEASAPAPQSMAA